MKTVSGFSKMSKEQKILWLATEVDQDSKDLVSNLAHYWHPDTETQKRFDEFSENTLTNFDLPFGVAPNFLINGKVYTVPMVIEESSVVAAASLSAKFWLKRGGFNARVISTVKEGQVHFLWKGDSLKLLAAFDSIKTDLLNSVMDITTNMAKRGGGIVNLEIVNLTDKLEDYYQLKVKAETCNAMGANFINSILEQMGKILTQKVEGVEVIMCILSNYTPSCVVECSVECPVDELGEFAGGMDSQTFARRFVTAVNIAKVDTSRAVTHNKGIMNGIDAVVLATGNDFRATEACAHAYAARDGQYRSLSSASIENNIFKFSIQLPLAVGTVGGLTTVHPLAKTSLGILGQPSAPELMMIMAATGLAQNFGAVKSLVTTGIQKGHMKLHLLNILTQLNATNDQVEEAKAFFADKVISYTAVRNFLN
jgi:hydroxymethylglutaryl-CoA reductase